jgi:hypothetical protein
MAKYIRIDILAQQHPEMIELLIEQNGLIVGKNKETQHSESLQFATLYKSNPHFWKVKNNWDYYIRSESLKDLIQNEKPIGLKMKRPVSEVMGPQYETILGLPPEERTKKLESSIDQLETLLHKKKASSKEISEILVESSVYGAIINKITMEDDQSGVENQFHSMKISKNTEKLMDSLIDVISRDFDYKDTLSIIDNSSGGITLKHMTRVFIQTMTFMDFINHQVEYSGLNTSLIGRFKRYKELYRPLYPQLKTQDITLHRILLEPIKISEQLLRSICLGIMLHDIGKKKNYCYFEGTQDYDRKIIESHSFDGYFMILKRNLYSEEVAAIAGMHHEYYGDPSGYGIYRDRIEDQFSLNTTEHKFSGLMTMDYKKIRDFDAFAYLPAKVVEIVDIYDALVDPAREYKPAMSPLNSIKFMKENMIEKNLKLDPILFDLYVLMMKQKGVLV